MSKRVSEKIGEKLKRVRDWAGDRKGGMDYKKEEEPCLELLARIALLEEGDSLLVDYVRVASLGGGLFRLEIDEREAARALSSASPEGATGG